MILSPFLHTREKVNLFRTNPLRVSGGRALLVWDTINSKQVPIIYTNDTQEKGEAK